MSRTRSPLFAALLALALSPIPARCQDAPPEESADQRFDRLHAEGMKDPAKADWRALRAAFADTSHYSPYSTGTRERLSEIALEIGRGRFEQSEEALLELAEQQRSMRFDTLGLLVRLYERSDQPEKAEKYREILTGLLGVLKYPDEGTSYDKPIEVLYIEEEYLVTTNMPVQGRALMFHEGHRFDVFDIDAEGDEPARKIYFNVDLPHKALSRITEKIMKDREPSRP